MKEDEEIMKPFTLMELKAMCLLCAATGALSVSYAGAGKFKNQVEGREWVEKEVEEIIAIRWNSAEKFEEKE